MKMNFRFAVNRLLVTHFEDCFHFYHDILGFDYQAGDETGPYVEFKTGDTLLALFDRGYMALVVGAGGKPIQAECQDRAALIFSVDDVDEAYSFLRVKGVSFTTEPRNRPDWGIRTAHLRDPDGNLVEIYSPLDN
jgi:catechol 2,3-dioxygenase-like lactoylglutathione lyase family enzyme